MGLQDAPVPRREIHLQGWGQQREKLEKEDLFWVYNTDAEHSDICPIEAREASYNLELEQLSPGLLLFSEAALASIGEKFHSVLRLWSQEDCWGFLCFMED